MPSGAPSCLKSLFQGLFLGKPSHRQCNNNNNNNGESESHSIVSDSLWPHGLYSPWNSLGQNTGVGSCSLLQGIFPTQGSNLGLLHCRQSLYQLNLKGSPGILEWVAYPFSSRSSRPRNWTRVSSIAGGFFTNWAIREAIITVTAVYWMPDMCQPSCILTSCNSPNKPSKWTLSPRCLCWDASGSAGGSLTQDS